MRLSSGTNFIDQKRLEAWITLDDLDILWIQPGKDRHWNQLHFNMLSRFCFRVIIYTQAT